MAFLNIPKGKSEFEKIRREGLYYVDKTGLIGEILKSSGTQVTLITRPRRFGKTLGMSTLECFLDIQKDSKSLFEGLEISKQKDICDAWMNQWPVMSLSLKAVEGNDFSTAYEQFAYEIGELYKKSRTVLHKRQTDFEHSDDYMYKRKHRCQPKGRRLNVHKYMFQILFHQQLSSGNRNSR